MSAWMEATFTRAYPGISVRGELHWTDRPCRVTALFGPSGCGKTTVLRCLAGLEHLDQGFIRAFGQTWSNPSQRIHVAPQLRGVGFLFQDYMLFPHLTVRDNIAFGVPSQLDAHTEVDKLLHRFQLTGLNRRYPRELSGGQQQRVALARVLAAQPRLLCLDEPLSALDGPTRTELRIALREWLRELQLPALIVSHDAIDVQALADDLVVMSDGTMRQTGPVEEVLRKPVDQQVATIVGFENFLPVNVIGHTADGVIVEHHSWRILGVNQLPASSTARAMACIRAEDIRLQRTSSHPTTSTARLLELIPEGAMLRARLKLASDQVLQAIVPRSATAQSGIQPGETVSIDLAPATAVVVPNGGR